VTEGRSEIRVVIIDDHVAFREGVAEVLSAEPGIIVVAQGGTAAEAIEVVSRERPDVAVLDMNMPGGGLAAVARITALCPEVTVLLLTVVADPDQIQAAVHMGAGGYLQKGVSGAELISTIQKIYNGAFFASPQLVTETGTPSGLPG
jgi:two-component system, NarL family, nitrate/nitrite response regulator NarL